MLPLAWDEPADRIAMSEAGELLTAYLALHCSDRSPRALVVRGGLASAALRRVRDYVETNLRQDLALHAAGVPMVVASQFPITTAASIQLVEVLYSGLLWCEDPRLLLNVLNGKG